MIYRTKIVMSIFFAAVLASTLYVLFVEYFGPQLNDNHAKEQQDIMEEILLPSNVRRVDSSNYVGFSNGGENFIIWVGLAVETDLTISELEERIQSISGLENTVIVAYSLEFANQCKFTGVQKEMQDMLNYYIVGKTIKPQTCFDKRNR